MSNITSATASEDVTRLVAERRNAGDRLVQQHLRSRTPFLQTRWTDR
jgi:hypothetical protein